MHLSRDRQGAEGYLESGYFRVAIVFRAPLFSELGEESKNIRESIQYRFFLLHGTSSYQNYTQSDEAITGHSFSLGKQRSTITFKLLSCNAKCPAGIGILFSAAASKS